MVAVNDSGTMIKPCGVVYTTAWTTGVIFGDNASKLSMAYTGVFTRYNAQIMVYVT